MEPVIKWSGSKRSIAPLVANLFPKSNRYIEPFVGGGALLPYRPNKKALAGDIIEELIALWVSIRDVPRIVAKEYELRWHRLQKEGHRAYYKIRDSFNVSRNPHDLLFLTRTCVNGLIRFNGNHEFNNSLHHTRPGISPNRLTSLIYAWSRAVQNVEFRSSDYSRTLSSASAGDLVFLDPPYAGTKGRYLPGGFSLDEFCEQLRRLNKIGAKWVLTFDGKAGERQYAASIPENLYKVKLALATGNSPFTRLMKTSVDQVVESVYLNFEPPAKILRQTQNLHNNVLGRRSCHDMQQSQLFP